MAPKPELPSVPTLLRLSVEYEMSDEAIAARYGVSRQAVHKKLKDFRPSRAKPRVSLPWELSNDHRQGWLYERVLLLLRAGSPDASLNERQHQRLAALLDVLERLEMTVGVPHVIDYEPDSEHGLYLRPVRSTDDVDCILSSRGTNEDAGS